MKVKVTYTKKDGSKHSLVAGVESVDTIEDKQRMSSLLKEELVSRGAISHSIEIMED